MLGQNKNAIEELRKLGQNCRILVVDDEPNNLELLEQILVGVAGIHVDMVTNGLLAVNAIKEKEYSLIIMDIQMPVMDGIEASRKIRETKSNQELPILALTGNVFLLEESRVSEDLFNGIVNKPFQITSLLNTIIEHLSL